MVTLSPKGRIDPDCLEAEIGRLHRPWSGQADNGAGILAEILDKQAIADAGSVPSLSACGDAAGQCANRSLSDAERALFGHQDQPNEARNCLL